MSSFKRKGSSKAPQAHPGTRPSPAASSTLITSTGIPSLDDILGGGLPLSCSLLIAAPDLHSSYGDLVQKYFVAQGLNCQHRLCIIDSNAEAFAKDIMWLPRGRNGVVPQPIVDEDEEKSGSQEDQKIKIAWRYEQMKPFQTTVSASSHASLSGGPVIRHTHLHLTLQSTDDYCHNFDLTNRVPVSVIEGGLRSGQLSFINPHSSGSERISTFKVLRDITDILESGTSEVQSSSAPLRICIPSLGSPPWGELKPQDVLYFLHSLRAILRQHRVCASLSLAPHLSTESWGGSGWLQRLGWVTDAALTLSAFSADPALTATFPNHHGLLHIHTLPAPHTLIPPSDKFSTLRGLSAASGSTGGSGENNLTFKSTRKRLIFETLHLDIEGGVGERRTTPSSTTLETTGDAHDHVTSQVDEDGRTKKTAFAAIEVAVEDSEVQKPGLFGFDGDDKATDGPEPKPKKQKKKVAFRADRPDLYDF
ncbi:PAXNEB-domain-containing protein [Lyophyllum atratum]|nr:PAXNEB-domain-containing protein [Lyophyllum atratum]